MKKLFKKDRMITEQREVNRQADRALRMQQAFTVIQ